MRKPKRRIAGADAPLGRSIMGVWMTTNNGSGSRIVLGALDLSSLDTGHTARLFVFDFVPFPPWR